MHKAALYQRSNGLQRRDAKQAIDEFSHVFQWREDGCDSILDIGCGSADVTIDYLLPILPENFERLVGVDISEDMVNFARQQYPNPRISFDKFDLNSDVEKQPFNATEPFDHITSFYCLHWIQNQERAIQNMYKLLKPNGDLLVVFLAQNPIFEIYKQMSLSKKWSKYMTDVDLFISPYQNSKNPADQFGKLLNSMGFTEYSVEIREKLFVFEGIDLLKSRWTSSLAGGVAMQLDFFSSVALLHSFRFRNFSTFLIHVWMFYFISFQNLWKRSTHLLSEFQTTNKMHFSMIISIM